jgi:hypothetical protein
MRLLPGVYVLIGAMPEEQAFAVFGGLLLTVASRAELSAGEFTDRLRQLGDIYGTRLAPRIADQGAGDA